MPTFVHLTQEKNIKSIRKNGIKASAIHLAEPSNGVFCMPMIDDYYASHQWVRELRRFVQKDIVAIYFHVDDQEPVYFGHFHDPLKLDKANEAVNAFMNLEDRLGFQVIIPRAILPRELIRVKAVSQILGWRFYPQAKGKKPCLCPACMPRGEQNTNRMYQQEFENRIRVIQEARSDQALRSALQALYQFLSLNPRKTFQDLSPIAHLASSSNIHVLMPFIYVVSCFTSGDAFQMLKTFLQHEHIEVKLTAVRAMFERKQQHTFEHLKEIELIPEVVEIIQEYKLIYEDGE